MVVQPLEQIDTFRTSALIGGAKKKKRRTMGSSQRGLFGKLRDTVTDVANTAAHKSTAMAATAIDAASSAAQGVGRFAKDTVQDVGFGLGLHAHGGAKGLRGISALVNSKSLDLRAHKEFFSKMVARANLSAVEFATNVEGSVNMKMKTTTTGSPIELWELHSNPNYRCALTIVVQHEVDSFFDVPVFAKLVEDKWQRFGYRMHLRRVLAYAFFVSICVASFCACSKLGSSTDHNWCCRSLLRRLPLIIALAAYDGQRLANRMSRTEKSFVLCMRNVLLPWNAPFNTVSISFFNSLEYLISCCNPTATEGSVSTISTPMVTSTGL